MKKYIWIIMIALVMSFGASMAFAAQETTVTIPAASPVSPPLATHSETGIKTLIPFRVWVTPFADNGVQTLGHYEFFEMYMDTGDASLVIDKDNPEAAVKAIVTEVMGVPAVK